jgi:hypothetical protein
MQLVLQTIMPPHTTVGMITWDKQAGTIKGDTALAAEVSQAAALAIKQGHIRPAPTQARVVIDQPFKHADQLAAVLAFADFYCPELSLPMLTSDDDLSADLSPVVY